MADNFTNDPLAERTRSNLAYISVAGAFIMLGYILYRWGDRVEILTLIIGLIGGTILGAVYGVYFAGSFTKKGDTPTVQQTGDNPTTTITPAPEQPVNTNTDGK